LTSSTLKQWSQKLKHLTIENVIYYSKILDTATSSFDLYNQSTSDKAHVTASNLVALRSIYVGFDKFSIGFNLLDIFPIKYAFIDYLPGSLLPQERDYRHFVPSSSLRKQGYR